MPVTKLRLVPAPHKRAMLEKEMRYDLWLGDQLAGEASFNMTGYIVTTQPGHLRGLITSEQSLTALKREVAHWNQIQTAPTH